MNRPLRVGDKIRLSNAFYWALPYPRNALSTLEVVAVDKLLAMVRDGSRRFWVDLGGLSMDAFDLIEEGPDPRSEPESIVRLRTIAATLSPDALRVLVAIAERLEFGQRTHGPLNLASDRRDWRKERLDELLDAMVYSEFERLSPQSTPEAPPADFTEAGRSRRTSGDAETPERDTRDAQDWGLKI